MFNNKTTNLMRSESDSERKDSCCPRVRYDARIRKLVKRTSEAHRTHN